MVSYVIFVEGSRTGPNSKNDQQECRKAFKQLFIKCGFSGRLPRIFASGSRTQAYSDFCNAFTKHLYSGHVAFLIDSEDPVADIEKPWEHLKNRPGDGWDRPLGAEDKQVLFMTVCQETWILADVLTKQGKSVPISIESTPKGDIFANLKKVTDGAYSKEHGKQFHFLEKVDVKSLEPLPSFRRIRTILNDELNTIS